MSKRYEVWSEIELGWPVRDTRAPLCMGEGEIAVCQSEEYANEVCAALNAADASAPPDSSPEGETVNVRVAVAVAPDGRWEACGTERDKGEDSMGDVVDSLIVDVNDQLGLATYYLTATLAVPTTNEVPATVESQKE